MQSSSDRLRRKFVWGRQLRFVIAAALLGLAGASTAHAQRRVTIEWDRNADPHTVGYQVFAGPASGHYIAQFDVGGQTRLPIDLPQGGAYYLVVHAYDDRGRFGPPSTEFVVDLTAVPQDPIGVRAVVSGDQVTLEWSPPTGGGRPLQYLVSVGRSPGGVEVLNGRAVGAALSASGVLPPGQYYARVQAANLVGAGPPSPDIAFQVSSTLRLAAPSHLTLRWNGADAVLAWLPPSGGAGRSLPTAYVLEAGTAAGLANIASLNVGAATAYTTRVPPGTYFVRVRGISPIGISHPSNEVVVRGGDVPGRPSHLVVSGGGQAVTFEWRTPAGPPVSAYVIEAGTASGRSDIGVLNVGNVNTFTTAAVPGIYYVRVRAVNGQGLGPPSDEVVVRR